MALRQALNIYLATRRSLGYRLRAHGVRLPKFVAFMEERHVCHVTTPVALEWALQSSPALYEPAKRLTMVRGFARYLKALDDRNEVPPHDLVSNRLRRVRPYLYTGEQVVSVLHAAWCRSSSEEPRGTYHCLFGLLSVTGMRVGEAILLMDHDVDLATATITVRSAKFGKSRLIPLHSTTVRVLGDYRRRRDAFLGDRPAVRFFVSKAGTSLLHTTINNVFATVCETVGLRKKVSGRYPRLHDFRHLFAVRTLINWYRGGQDIERQLPILATFLGHVCVSDTYWYLTAHPELMTLAVNRLNLRWEDK